MTQRKRRAERGGFSLIELLVAGAVLAIGVLAMAQLFLLAIEQNRRAAQNTESSNMLAHRLEQLRQMDYCTLWCNRSVTWSDELNLEGENLGQQANQPRVFAGRARKQVGDGDPLADWVIQRRIIAVNQVHGNTVTEAMADNEGMLLLEVRGYRRGVRSEGNKPKWVYMSSYRSPRAWQLNCRSRNPCPVP